MPITILQFMVLATFGVVYALQPGTRLISGTLSGWAGLALIVVGAGLSTVAFRHLGDSFRVPPQPRADAALVSHGIYTRLRHPIYSGLAIAIAGLVLTRATPWIVGAGVLAVAILAVKGAYEERLLADRHGEVYARYKSRTRGVVLLR